MSDEPFSLRKIAVPAYGPSLLYGLAQGTIVPVIALTARELGASVALSGLIAALIGIGSLFSNIPAAMLAARFGERRAMVGAALFSMLALVLCSLASRVWMLGVGVLMVGAAASVFLLARQSYLTEAVPLVLRARAMSLLGGSTRIGMFAGPFAGAGAIHAVGLPGAYWTAAVAMGGAGLIAFLSPEMTLRAREGAGGMRPSMLKVLREHAGVFMTLGMAVLLISVLRSSRQVVIPLWAEYLGMAPATISLVYGLVAAIDMAVFYPAGKVMDLKGRVWVAVPSSLIMAFAFLCIPFTTMPVAFIAVCLVLGFGNGISSGVIMTLGADFAPANARTQFLGIWRLMSDLGSSGGPALLAAVTALVSLGAGIATIGSLGLITAAVFWGWLPGGRRRER